MFARHDRIISALYLLADLLLALASFWWAFQIRSHLVTPRPLYPLENYYWIVPLAVAIWLAVGLAAGIYREIREEELRRAFSDPLKVAIIATTLLFAVTFAFKLEIISRLLLGLYAVADLAAMTLFRLVARAFAGPLRRSVAGFRHFLLVGDGPEVEEIARTLEAYESRGVRLFGFVRINTAPDRAGEFRSPRLRSSYPVFGLGEVPELLRRQVIDEVIFAVTKEELEKLEETFLLCEEEGIKTRVLLGFFPHVISTVYLERLGDKPLLTFTTTPEAEYLLLVKRLLDFMMALALLIILAPLLLILALLIKLT
ncbi:MAG: hypothetical protein LAP13_24620, partial [Acidobacteriia bacterium]|nr:hypothetical protein [Terriglobia bacterium]